MVTVSDVGPETGIFCASDHVGVVVYSGLLRVPVMLSKKSSTIASYCSSIVS